LSFKFSFRTRARVWCARARVRACVRACVCVGGAGGCTQFKNNLTVDKLMSHQSHQYMADIELLCIMTWM